MSLGYSVGDFLTVGILAWKLYQRCHDSVAEFRSISREVRGLHVVLKAIADHWKANDLSPKHQQNLEVLTDACSDTLHELELVLSKHESLEKNKKLDPNKLKWAVKSLAPIRSNLISSATLLAIFHDTVTSSANSAILRSIYLLMRDFQAGKREEPAFSQASSQSIQNDEEDTWSSITEELLASGVDATSIHSQKDFIKQYINDVCMAEESEDSKHIVGPEPDDALESQTPGHLALYPLTADNQPLSHFANEFERWDTLSSEWGSVTSHWIRLLEMGDEETRDQPMMERMSRQITDLSAAGANLFHAVVELQRLRAVSERDVQERFSDMQAEQEKALENKAQLEEALRHERQLRDAATNSLHHSLSDSMLRNAIGDGLYHRKYL